MSWEKRPLKAVADFCLGKMLDQKKNRGDLLPYLANVNVRWGSFELDDLREMRFEYHELDRFGLKYGDIVMCEGGEPGRCAIWKEQMPGMMFQKALHRIRPHECLNNKFMYYSFLHKGRTGHFAPLFTGTTIKHLPREKLAKVEVEVPPLPIQNRIASILSAYDDLIANNRRRIELLEQSARLVYKEWFVHLRFPGHEHTTITDGVPEGWERKTLGDVTAVRKGKNITKDLTKSGSVPVVAGGLSPAYYHDTANVDGPVITVSASGANAGYVNFYQENIWASDCSYISRMSAEFLYYFYLFLKSKQKEIYGFQRGSAQPHVYPKDLQRLPLHFPAESIIRSFEEFVSHNFHQAGILIKQNKLLTQARDLLLPRLMNGEILI